MLLGVMGHIVQGGLHVSSKRFKPNFKKLNPGPGLKNMFGAQSVWTLTKTLIKFVVFGAVAYVVTTGVVSQLTGTGRWSLSAIVSVASVSAMTILRLVAITGLVIAAADWAMERRRVEKSLRMTKDEIKRESRMQEGDPLAVSYTHLDVYKRQELLRLRLAYSALARNWREMVSTSAFTAAAPEHCAPRKRPNQY